MTYTGHRGWRGDVGKKQMRSRVSEVRDKKGDTGGGGRMEKERRRGEDGGEN